MSNSQKKPEATNVSAVFSIDFSDDSVIPGVTQLINPQMLAKRAEAKGKKDAKDAAAKVSLAPDPEPDPVAAAPKAPPKPSAPVMDSDGGISISLEDSSPALIVNHQHAPSSPVELDFTPAPIVATPVPEVLPVTAFAPSSNGNTQTSTSPLGSGSILGELGVQLEIQFEDQRGFHRFVRFKNHAASPQGWQEKFFAQMKLDLKKLAAVSNFEEYDSSQRFIQDVFGLSENQYVQIVRERENSVRVHVLLSSSSLAPHKALVIQKLFGPTETTGKIEIAF